MHFSGNFEGVRNTEFEGPVLGIVLISQLPHLKHDVFGEKRPDFAPTLIGGVIHSSYEMAVDT